MPLVRCIEGHVFERADNTICPTCGAVVAPPRAIPTPDPTPTPRPIGGGQAAPMPLPRPLPRKGGVSALSVVGGIALAIVLGGISTYLNMRKLMPPVVPQQTAEIQPAPAPAPQPVPAPTPAPAPPPQPVPQPQPAPQPQPTPGPTDAPIGFIHPPPAPPPPADNFIIPRASPPPASAPAAGQSISGTAQFDPGSGALTIAGREIRLFGVVAQSSQVAAANRLLQRITDGSNDVTCTLANAGTYDCRGTTTNVRLAPGLLLNGLAQAAHGVPGEFGRWESQARDARRGLWANQ